MMLISCVLSSDRVPLARRVIAAGRNRSFRIGEWFLFNFVAPLLPGNVRLVGVTVGEDSKKSFEDSD